MTDSNLTIPEGFKLNGRGDMVALTNIKDLDLLRDDLVTELVGKAKTVSQIVYCTTLATAGSSHFKDATT